MVGTGATLWYRYHLQVLPRKWQISPFSPIFLQYNSSNSSHIKKSTMESTQNNSKGGLESMKPLFLKLGLFPQNKNHKKMKFWFCCLTLVSLNLLFHVALSLRSKKWETISPKSLILANPSFSLTLCSHSLPKRVWSK